MLRLTCLMAVAVLWVSPAASSAEPTHLLKSKKNVGEDVRNDGKTWAQFLRDQAQ